MNITKANEEFHKRRGGQRHDQFSVTDVNAELEEKLTATEDFH